MKLTESNPYLADKESRKESTIVSVLTSSAIEGIYINELEVKWE